MRLTFPRSLALLVVVFAGLSRAQPAGNDAPQLMAATAWADITPPLGHPMGGYGNRKGGVASVHDPLRARVLVLKSGEESVAIVTCDLRSFVADRIRERVRRQSGIRHLLVSSSHTHSGPLTWELRSPWYAETEDKIVAAVAEAASRLEPVMVGVERGSVYLGHNRRKIGANGKAAMFWRNENEEPTSPVDPTVTVLRFDTVTGKTLALIVHYACHAVVLGPDNLAVSGDYPAAMAAEVERTLGGGVQCMFWQGAAGDTNVYKDKQPVAEGAFEEVERVGRTLAGEVLKVNQRIQPAAAPPLRVSAELVELQNRWEPQKTIEAGISALTLGQQFAVLTMPGEPFIELQMAFRDRAELPHALLVGYTSGAGNDWIGYIPTIEAAVSGGYGASYNTTVEVGAGERLLLRGLVLIYEQLGWLKEVPR